MNVDRYRDTDYARLNTSPEILCAIDILADDDVRDEFGPARALWNREAWAIRDEDLLELINGAFASTASQGSELVWLGVGVWALHDGTRYAVVLK
jgi:hypothetical protein